MALVLIILTLFSAGGWVLLYPKPAQAVFADTIGGPANITANIRDALKWAWEKTRDAIKWAAEQIKTAYTIWQKSDSLLARASRVAAQIALHTVLKMMTNEIITWIQGGGEPRFISDWKGFLEGAGNKAGGLFVDKYLGAGYLCEPFDMNIKFALQDVPTFETKVRCTLEEMGINIKNFHNDLAYGGWTGWLELTKPQNHFSGGYLIAQNEKTEREAKSKEAADKEALVGRGFLSVKACIKGSAEDSMSGATYDTCSSKDSCADLKDLAKAAGDDFICAKEIAVTPGSLLSDITSRAMDRDLDTLSRQVADLTDSLGSFAPYVIAISNALINKVIQKGFAAVTTSGPTVDNPDEPLPDGTGIPEANDAIADIATDGTDSEILLTLQELLKEKLEEELLSQQQSNLSVMRDIRTSQNNILNTLLSILEENCSSTFPDWANQETISQESIERNRTKTTARLIHDSDSLLYEKISWTEIADRETITYATYEIIETTLAIDDEITVLENDITATTQWIIDTDSAIDATATYVEATNLYSELYEAGEEQSVLDAQQAIVDAAWPTVLSIGQIVARSTAEELPNLKNDTRDTLMNIIDTAYGLLEARGMSEEYPEAGTLYEEKESLQTKLTQVSATLNRCLNPDEGHP